MKNPFESYLLTSVFCLITFTGCQQSIITNNDGLFQKDSKALEESLIGQWVINEAEGQKVIYEFSRNVDREVKLFVKGSEIEMTSFRSNGGDQFSFEYMMDSAKVIVVAQFKSYDKQSLICISESSNSLRMENPMIVLDKVTMGSDQ